MPIGILKRYNDVRKFGFIVCDSEPLEDTFVHITELNRAGIKNPQPGMPLAYEISEREGKTCAINIEAIRSRSADYSD
jgi:cold shock CspA family protein